MTVTDHESWRAVRRGASRRALLEASFVLTAVDLPHEIFEDEHDWCVRVPAELAPQAMAHLENYQLENVPIPAAPAPVEMDSGWLGVFGYVLVIWALPSLEANAAFGWDWLAIGRLEAGRLLAGEWWRAVTALTLHADFGHILGNTAFGVVFGLFAGRYLGSGLAWLLIVLAGAAGNAIAAGFRPDQFSSVGASTATFAALALTSGFVWRRGYFRGRGWRRAFAPLFGAIALLSFTGMGGERTDVLAHFTGFAVGLGLGIWAADWPLRRLGRSGQVLCGAAALLLVVLAWWFAGTAAEAVT